MSSTFYHMWISAEFVRVLPEPQLTTVVIQGQRVTKTVTAHDAYSWFSDAVLMDDEKPVTQFQLMNYAIEKILNGPTIKDNGFLKEHMKIIGFGCGRNQL